MKKKLFVFLFGMLTLFCLIGFPNSSFASEDIGNSTLIYDLNQIDTEVIAYNDENGDQVELIVERVSSFSRVANGTYKITKTVAGIVNVSFYTN